jgi:hypothetical protein
MYYLLILSLVLSVNIHLINIKNSGAKRLLIVVGLQYLKNEVKLQSHDA